MVGTPFGQLLHPGMDVLIQRSDGRIHPATISEVRTNNRSVCVEWRERNETKGKEVLLDLILELNPLLCPTEDNRNNDRATSTGDASSTLVPTEQKASNRDGSKSPSPAARRSMKIRNSPSNGVVLQCAEPREHSRQVSIQLSKQQKKCSDPSKESKHSDILAETTAAGVQTKRESPKMVQKSEDFERKNILRRTQRITDKLVSEKQPPVHGGAAQLDNEQLTKCGPDLSNNLSVPQEKARSQQQRSYSSDPAALNAHTDVNSLNMSRSSSVASSRNDCERTKGRLYKVGGKIAGALGDAKKTNCLIQIQRIAQKRQQRRIEQGVEQRRLNGNYMPKGGQYRSSAVPGFRMSAGLHTAIVHQRQLEFCQMIEQYRRNLPSSSTLDERVVDDGRGKERIIVSVRKRPLSSKEHKRNELDIVSIVGPDLCVVHSPKEKVDLTKYLDNQKFRFDYAFSEKATTELVYQCTVKPLVENILAGHHAMCFAYGQTGSGKTYTMGGTLVEGTNRVDCSNGIYALATREIFRELDSHRPGEFSLFCSFFEIYCGKVFDLFNKKKRLQVMEDQKGVIQVVKLKQEHVRSVEELMSLMQFGMTIRTSGTTSANENSSRSHAVFQMILKANATGADYGRISLIDLAGSERGKDTSSSNRSTLMEGAEINKSLLALKECIRALSTRAEHIPFRGSMLTRVLRDSFIGTDAKLSMIAMISPSDSNSEHTLNTLRYADRVKELRTIEGAPNEKMMPTCVRFGDVANDGSENEMKRNADPKADAVFSGDTRQQGAEPSQVNVRSCKSKTGRLVATADVNEIRPRLASAAMATDHSLICRKRAGAQLTQIEPMGSSSAVSPVTDMERQLLLAHKECVQNAQRFLTQIAQVLASASEESPTDDDRIRYASSFEALLLDHIKYLNRVKLKTCAYKETIKWRNTLKPAPGDDDSVQTRVDESQQLASKSQDDSHKLVFRSPRTRRSLTS